MSTNSEIIVECNDGKFRGITVHWDGYNTLDILHKFYTTQEKVEALVALGNLSVLGAEIGEKHDFGQGGVAVCTAYIRDRGEPARHNVAKVGQTAASVRQLGGRYSHVWYRATATWL